MCASEEESSNLCAQVGDQHWDRSCFPKLPGFGKVQVEVWNHRELGVRIQQEVEISQGGCAGHSYGWSELGISRSVGGAREIDGSETRVQDLHVGTLGPHRRHHMVPDTFESCHPRELGLED